MKMGKNQSKQSMWQFPFHIYIPLCMMGMGLFSAGCQPILIDEIPPSHMDARPENARQTEQFRNALPPPVPEVAWSEPPPCEGPETTCARLQGGGSLHPLVKGPKLPVPVSSIGPIRSCVNSSGLTKVLRAKRVLSPMYRVGSPAFHRILHDSLCRRLRDIRLVVRFFCMI